MANFTILSLRGDLTHNNYANLSHSKCTLQVEVTVYIVTDPFITVQNSL